MSKFLGKTMKREMNSLCKALDTINSIKFYSPESAKF